MIARDSEGLLVVEEIMAYVREDTLRYPVAAHSLVVVLRSGHGEEEEDDIEQEEGAQYDEGGIGKALVALEEIIERHSGYHGEVADVAQRQQFADPR